MTLAHDLPPAAPRFERLPAVMHRTGLSRSSIYAKMRAGSFPRPVPLGSAYVVAWLAAEVDAWISAQVRAARPESLDTAA